MYLFINIYSIWYFFTDDELANECFTAVSVFSVAWASILSLIFVTVPSAAEESEVCHRFEL